jgi:hypothetical protein
VYFLFVVPSSPGLLVPSSLLFSVNNTGLMWDLAFSLKARVVFAEHRYFGESVPKVQCMCVGCVWCMVYSVLEYSVWCIVWCSAVWYCSANKQI